ncbi:type I restriction enzyme M protein [Lishizhenia tianjinensis]|uniref:site-specific DNA-methyltransferase (adenine-specific) n=1 Tax=Lishizhenia tianjinensis TaxID=477690 RepID=A0A1I6XD34_9FLAO|nr:class I SAM-dependent DNA methyltransferase [Lishizhenia tianjinensis]SFT36220.1 type I restriction enzyme M protein [Lishizhenia tianjinensis]
MITGELKSQVDKIWESFWTGGITNPITVIEQFTYLLFIRRLDEKQLLEEKKANLIGKPLEKPPFFTAAQEALRWNKLKDQDAEVMFDLFTKPMVDDMTVFDHMKQVGSDAGVFGEFMKGATFMISTPRLLDQVVQMIAGIKMEDRDTKGDLYEYLLSKTASAGKNGQFRTPRHIIKMMVEMMQPQKEDTICDPSSGTAGFLVSAGEYIHENHEEWFHEKDFREHYHNKMFTGVEFDSTMLRIGAMNLQLHGIDHPNLIGKDALSESNADVRNQFSLILANPPFKGSLDYDSVESSLLKTVKTKKTELLFLALMLRMLKIGGRAAVIIPDGVLFGSSKAHKQIRQEIIENNKLEAVISMPSGVFKPYAGVSTAVVIFTKTGNGGTDDVWFYDMKADGYSLDDKRAEVKENDIPDILARYSQLEQEKERKRTDSSFLVPFEEIKNNDWDLSINRYKEIVYEEIEYAAPEVLIKEIEGLDKERNKALKVLKDILG